MLQINPTVTIKDASKLSALQFYWYIYIIIFIIDIIAISFSRLSLLLLLYHLPHFACPLIVYSFFISFLLYSLQSIFSFCSPHFTKALQHFIIFLWFLAEACWEGQVNLLLILFRFVFIHFLCLFYSFYFFVFSMKCNKLKIFSFFLFLISFAWLKTWHLIW